MPSNRLAVALAASLAAPALAQWNAVAYVDAQGREWRQPSFSCGASWDQVAALCPTDGTSPCAGVLNNFSIDGWVWATREQVQALLVELGAGVDAANCVTGAAVDGAVFQFFTNTLSPENGYYVEGWSATLPTGAGLAGYALTPSVRLDLDVMLAMTCAGGIYPRHLGDPGRGVWLFREPCPADLNSDGTVNGADLGAMLAQWGPASAQSPADLTRDGTVDGADLGMLLASWGVGQCQP